MSKAREMSLPRKIKRGLVKFKFSELFQKHMPYRRTNRGSFTAI